MPEITEQNLKINQFACKFRRRVDQPVLLLTQWDGSLSLSIDFLIQGFFAPHQRSAKACIILIIIINQFDKKFHT